MGEMVPILVSLGFFTMVVLIVYFGASRRHTERVELIKRGINPEKYDIKLPGRFGLPLGVIFLAIGIGGITTMAVGGRIDYEDLWGAVTAFLGGIGLIVYWKLTAGDRERALKLKEELILRPGTDFEPDTKTEK